MVSDGRLRGKTAVVTGGNSGIGRAISREFVAEGARITIFGRNPDTLSEMESLLAGACVPVEGDVTREDDLERLFAINEEKHKALDILVVNAGIAVFKPIEQVDYETFDRVADVNFKGAFFTIQKALPYMRRGASIVIISSNAQNLGIPTASVYCATKAAVRSLARSLSAELAPRGIRVNAVSPGPVETPIFAKLGLSREHLVATKAHMVEQVPLHRLGLPREIARAVVFLASADSSFILGEELTVDGGWVNL